MTQPYKKKLIEVAIPMEAINGASAHEKMPGIGAHPRGLHLWWARRPFAREPRYVRGALSDHEPSFEHTAIQFHLKRLLERAEKPQ